MKVRRSKKPVSSMLDRQKLVLFAVLAGVIVIGLAAIIKSQAATYSISAQPEAGTKTAPATQVADTNASGGQAVAFNAAPTGTAGEGFSIPGTELIYQTQANIDADMKRVADSGAKWIRFDFAAVQMETTQGVTNFTNVDKGVNSARAHGLKVVGILTTLPAWTASSWTVGPTTAAQRTAYTNWAVRTVQHYNGLVDAYEIWNEPNLDQFWSPTPSTTAYADLYKQVYPAIKPYTGSAKIITGGTGGSGGAPDVDTNTWINAFYTNGLKGMYDGIAVHPYLSGATVPSGQMSRAKEVRTIMNNNGETTKELWGTEYGAPTSGDFSITEAQQSTIVTQGYDFWHTMNNTGPLLWYALRDRQAYGATTEREDYFGIFHKDNTPKPAYSTLTNWIKAHP